MCKGEGRTHKMTQVAKQTRAQQKRPERDGRHDNQHLGGAHDGHGEQDRVARLVGRERAVVGVRGSVQDTVMSVLLMSVRVTSRRSHVASLPSSTAGICA